MSKALHTWLGTFSSVATQSTYTSNIRMFMQFIFGDGDVFEQVDQYLEEKKHDITLMMRDLDRYWASTKNLAPKTRLDKMSTLRTFFIDCYITMPEAFWKKFAGRGHKPRPISKEMMLTTREIRKIISVSRAHGTALVMTMSSAGTRIGETLHIEIDDMALDKDPPRIYLREETTKNKQPRVVFLTSEAKDAIEDWLQVRDAYLEDKKGRGKYIPGEENRLFPFTKQNAYQMWYNSMKDLKLNERDTKTGRLAYRYHGFRKRFRTFLATEIPVDIVESIMGHSGYETDAYRRHSEEELARFYKKGCHVLMIYNERAEIAKIAVQHEENNIVLQEQLKAKEREMDEVKLKVAELSSTLARLELKMDEEKKKE